METLLKAFDKLGLPFEIGPDLSRMGLRKYSIDVTEDRTGKEQFLIALSPGMELVVLDKEPKERALLVLVNDRNLPKDPKVAKFLLGHDERQLFVAAVPRNAKSVSDAKQGLKPIFILEAEHRAGVKKAKRHKHKNRARIRQGDFFFLPQPDMQVPDELVLRNEPINRGRGHTHKLEFCYRYAGEPMRVVRRGPEGVIESVDYEKFLKDNPSARRPGWVPRRIGAQVYAKGKVTHKQHKTIVLNCWHMVLTNTESEQEGFRDLVFLD